MISDNLARIRQSLPGKTQLLAVSKTKPIESIIEAYAAGQRDFGENKVQELWEKSQKLQYLSDIRWHFIGHLQSNKLNKLLDVPGLYAIHSLDSLSLLEKLLKKNSGIKIFLQVNTSRETEKFGFTELAHIESAVELLQGQGNFEFAGLMTMGSIRSDDFEQSARSSFEQLKGLKEQLDSKFGTDLQLSMGMSQDYKIAMELGSSWIRLGTQIFGARG